MRTDVDRLVAGLAPVTDQEVAGFVAAEQHRELVERITATFTTGSKPTRRLVPARGRFRVLAPLAAGVAAVAVVGVVVGVVVGNQGGASNGKQNAAPTTARTSLAQAQVMAFSKPSHGYITVHVTDLFADPAKYNQEFAAHGLHISLTLVPASPTVVGTLVYSDGGDQVRPITAANGCRTAGGAACVIGLKIPVDYKGTANFTFGRPARPGEQYESANDETTPGEALYGVHLKGLRISALRSLLARHHLTAARFNVNVGNQSVPVSSAPGDWFVEDVLPWSSTQVLVFAGPNPGGTGSVSTPPGPVVAGSTSPPSGGAPTPSPTGR